MTGLSDTRPVNRLTSSSMDRRGEVVNAGSDIVFEVHYMAEGKAGTDRTKVGLVFAKEPPKERVFTLSEVNGKFKIPPGDPNYQVESSITMRPQVSLASHASAHASRGAKISNTGWYIQTERSEDADRAGL